MNKVKKEISKKAYLKLEKNNITKVIIALIKYYPEATCSLNFSTPFSLIVALILAAQCTDERVNKITPILFTKYPTVYDIANSDVTDIEKIIKPCGFYKNKAKNIVESAKIIVNQFEGKIPNTMEKLCTLKGIGRKSANIVLQECFSKTVGIAVDTHVTRISRKIGLSNSNSAIKIENDLKKIIDKKYWNTINHVFVYHGRAICIARRPQCQICPINNLCKKND